MRRLGLAISAVTLFGLLIPLAARTEEPYHEVAVLIVGAGASVIAFSLWRRPGLLPLGVVAAICGYCLSFVGRSGTDPAVPLAAAIIAAGLTLARASSDAPPSGAHDRTHSPFTDAGMAAIGAAAITELVSLVGRSHGPTGLPAEAVGLGAIVLLPLIYWRRNRSDEVDARD